VHPRFHPACTHQEKEPKGKENDRKQAEHAKTIPIRRVVWGLVGKGGCGGTPCDIEDGDPHRVDIEDILPCVVGHHMIAPVGCVERDREPELVAFFPQTCLGIREQDDTIGAGNAHHHGRIVYIGIRKYQDGHLLVSLDIGRKRDSGLEFLDLERYEPKRFVPCGACPRSPCQEQVTPVGTWCWDLTSPGSGR